MPEAIAHLHPTYIINSPLLYQRYLRAYISFDKSSPSSPADTLSGTNIRTDRLPSAFCLWTEPSTIAIFGLRDANKTTIPAWFHSLRVIIASSILPRNLRLAGLTRRGRGHHDGRDELYNCAGSVFCTRRQDTLVKRWVYLMASSPRVFRH
ncbi:hypothetical protein V8C43DRAFT_282427 [Trichoderma afarasin]